MNIVIVVDRYHPHIGGIERYVQGLSGQLTRDGHQITIVTGPAPNSLGAEITPDAGIIRTPALEDASSNPQTALGRSGKLARILDAMTPDVVYANGHASPGAVRAAQTVGVPVVCGCHGWGLMCPSKIRLVKQTGELCEAETGMNACMKCYASGPAPLKVKIPGFAKQAARVRRYVGYHDILNTADARIGISQIAADMFREQNNTFAIHPGLDLDAYRPVDSDEFRAQFNIKGEYVLVPGRLNPIKGQMDALRAIHESRLDLTVVFAGNASLDPASREDAGPYGRAIWERAEQLGITDRVVFTGMLSQPEMVEAFSGAVATVVPSVWAEPFGYVAAESMACGTPVVITKNSGAAELVDDEVGQTVPRQDHYAIARALERVVPQSERLGTAARSRVEERLSWPRVATRIMDVFEKVSARSSASMADAA